MTDLYAVQEIRFGRGGGGMSLRMVATSLSGASAAMASLATSAADVAGRPVPDIDKIKLPDGSPMWVRSLSESHYFRIVRVIPDEMIPFSTQD